MEHLSNMTRDQKERYVLDLYEQGKTIRQIAQLAHMSFGDIGTITKKHKKEMERENKPPKERTYNRPKSKVTQAIKLFSEGKTLVDVAIALDLPPDKVQEMHRQFLQLNNMDKLVRVFDEMQDYLPSLLEFFRLVVNRGLNPNDVINAVRIIITGRLEYLQGEAEYLQGKLQTRSNALNWLDDQIKKKQYLLRSLESRLKEGGVIPMSNSTNEPTYRPDDIYNIYPPPPVDTSIKSIPYMQD